MKYCSINFIFLRNFNELGIESFSISASVFSRVCTHFILVLFARNGWLVEFYLRDNREILCKIAHSYMSLCIEEVSYNWVVGNFF